MFGVSFVVIAAHLCSPTTGTGFFGVLFNSASRATEGSEEGTADRVVDPTLTHVSHIAKSAYNGIRMQIETPKELDLLSFYADHIMTSGNYQLHRLGNRRYSVDVPLYLDSPRGAVRAERIPLGELQSAGQSEATYALSDAAEGLVARFAIDCRDSWQSHVHELTRDYLFSSYLSEPGEVPTALNVHMVSPPVLRSNGVSLPDGVVLTGKILHEDFEELVDCTLAYIITEDVRGDTFADWNPSSFKDVMVAFLAGVQALERLHVKKGVVHGHITAERIVFFPRGDLVGFTHLGHAFFASDHFKYPDWAHTHRSNIQIPSVADFYYSPYFPRAIARSYRDDLWALIMSVSLVLNGPGIHDYLMGLPDRAWVGTTFLSFIRREFVFKYPDGQTLTQMLPEGTSTKVKNIVKKSLGGILHIARSVGVYNQVPDYESIGAAIRTLIRIL